MLKQNSHAFLYIIFTLEIKKHIDVSFAFVFPFLFQVLKKGVAISSGISLHFQSGNKYLRHFCSDILRCLYRQLDFDLEKNFPL